MLQRLPLPLVAVFGLITAAVAQGVPPAQAVPPLPELKFAPV